MFQSDELLALSPEDLAGLLYESAPGAPIERRAEVLGLDLSDHEQRAAVERACLATGVPSVAWDTAPYRDVETPNGRVVPEGRVIGAGQDHIRENLMPDETPGHGPTDGGETDLRELTDALSADLSGDEPALGTPDELSAALDESRATGRPFLAGTFAAYATPDGGVMLVTEDPQGNVRRDAFPPRIVRLVLGLMAGKAPKGMGFLARMVNRGQ